MKIVKPLENSGISCYQGEWRLWFWRPMLYQLSYTPKKQILSFIELPYEHRDTALETSALPTELYPCIESQTPWFYGLYDCFLVIKLLSSIDFWRPLLYQLSYTPMYSQRIYYTSKIMLCQLFFTKNS